jgi:HlyD family secretion protein
VRVRAPGLELAGHVASVNPSVEQGTLTFVVALDEPSRDGLRPSLRVDAWVVVESRVGVTCVTRGAGMRGNSKSPVFVVEGDKALQRDVTFGLAGPDRIEIAAGLREGDDVVVSDMSTHGSAETVRFK